MGADIFEKFCPQKDAVDADEVLLKIHLECNVLKLGRCECGHTVQHIALNLEGGCHTQVEYGEEEHEVDDIHRVPEVFEVLSGP